MSNQNQAAGGQAKVCPQCGKSEAVIPIVWGGPAPGDAEKVRRGEIRMGGCVLPENGPVPLCYCKSCDLSF